MEASSGGAGASPLLVVELRLGTDAVRGKWEATDGLAAEGAEGGKVGLRNLGNSAYMNSMLQCLNTAEPLVEYFRAGKHQKDLNRSNPLSTGGVLAEAFGDMIEQMWSGKFQVVAPADLKEKLGRFAPQFAGYNQQDSMELFNFLMDNIHEDVNRIHKKPPTETPDDEGQGDEELAKAWWDVYLLRNSSIVVDTFSGQFKSHLTCPNQCCVDAAGNPCPQESRKFDPFTFVSLALPPPKGKSTTWKVHHPGKNVAVEHKIVLPKNPTGAAVLEALTKEVPGLTAHNTLAVELNPTQLRLTKTLCAPGMTVTDLAKVHYNMRDDDELHVWVVPEPTIDTELPEPGWKATVKNTYYQQAPALFNGEQHTHWQVEVRFGWLKPAYYATMEPAFSQMANSAFITVARAETAASVRRRICELVEPYVVAGEDDDEGKPPFEIYMSNLYGVVKEGAYASKGPPVGLPDDSTTMEKVLAREKDMSISVQFADPKRFNAELADASEPVSRGAGGEGGTDELSLESCLHKFSLREQLSEMDTWYCRGCKDHVRAFKQMDLWAVPPVLCFQLKRFQYETGQFNHIREKIECFVDFPEYVDLKPYVKGPQSAEEHLTYELVSVSNHIGYGMGGGHYTAYVKRGDTWWLHNDATITEAKLKNVISDEAYALFYRRIDGPIPDKDAAATSGGGGGGGDGGGGGAAL